MEEQAKRDRDAFLLLESIEGLGDLGDIGATKPPRMPTAVQSNEDQTLSQAIQANRVVPNRDSYGSDNPVSAVLWLLLGLLWFLVKTVAKILFWTILAVGFIVKFVLSLVSGNGLFRRGKNTHGEPCDHFSHFC